MKARREEWKVGVGEEMRHEQAAVALLHFHHDGKKRHAFVAPRLAKVIAGGKVGTWTYWAPEQADREKPYDQSVDLWSLGVVLYIMLSGRHPFERAGDPCAVLLPTHRPAVT